MLVSLMAGRAEVKFDPEVLTAAAVPQLLEDMGFTAELMEDQALEPGKLDLTVSPCSALNGRWSAVETLPTPPLRHQISGMTCSSCVHNIETRLLATRGVLKASVALATKKAQVQFDPGDVGPRDIIRIIQVAANFCFILLLLLYILALIVCLLLLQALGFQATLEQTGLKNNLDHSEEIQQQVSGFQFRILAD